MKRFMLPALIVAALSIAACATPFLPEGNFVISGNVRLEAELVVPEGGSALKRAVIFSPGSSVVHFEDYTPGFTEHLVESIFLPRDYAVLYVNKRGVGKSSGNWKMSSIEERAADLIASVEHLKSTPGIDPNRIGVIGHSQGGWVVQLAGSLEPDIAFVISLAGPTVSVREQDMHRLENELNCQGVTGDDRTAALEKLERKHETMISVGQWFPFFQLRLSSNIFSYSPNEALKGLKSPTLLAFAENDALVPPLQNRSRLDEIFPNGIPATITWHTAASTDHAFKIADNPCNTYESQLGAPYSEEFRSYLAGWVDALGY